MRNINCSRFRLLINGPIGFAAMAYGAWLVGLFVAKALPDGTSRLWGWFTSRDKP